MGKGNAGNIVVPCNASVTGTAMPLYLRGDKPKQRVAVPMDSFITKDSNFERRPICAYLYHKMVRFCNQVTRAAYSMTITKRGSNVAPLHVTGGPIVSAPNLMQRGT